MLTSRAAPLLLVAACPLVLKAPATLGCGGCYVHEQVVDLRSEPNTPCLGLSAGGVDPCDGGYSITIDNDCADPLTLEDGTTIAAGLGAQVPASTGDGSARAVHGTLGAVSMTILWSLKSTD